MIRILKATGLLLVLGYVIAFVLWNGDLVSMSLPPFERHQMPGWVVVALAGATGALGSALGLIWPLMRMRGQVRRDAKRIARLEEELHGLRTLPLEARHGAEALSSARLEDVEKAAAPDA